MNYNIPLDSTAQVYPPPEVEKKPSFWCKFGFHKWSEWNIVEFTNLQNKYNRIIGSYCIQQRKCIKCNLKEYKKTVIYDKSGVE